ncbi:TspO/MBR family protein [Dysgonomonas sp. GY617]|uniref:TspO/MBR family protein n=1 Tax=Dysgonomonas sp. GY617 TaxID=2780420 RepID=UPI0018833FEB|nr:TspO/MBR family protein [Dysgonomonas sp. GY617]MBF0576197.1 tryptophan-rich sensory protein [Dysgonomonas sp. GY617]
MKKKLQILIPILICFFVGFIGSCFQADAISNWYPYLNKPDLTPPNVVFPVAWSVLYVLMGISIGLIMNSNSRKKKYFVKIFLLQLFLNFTWSISFFYFQSPIAGLVNIVLLEIVIIYYALSVYPIRRLSTLLFVPYVLWVSFASYLNFYILLYN